MEKHDFRYSLCFGELGPELADTYIKDGAVPVMLDPDGSPVKRNFIHVSDLVEAILKALDHPKACQQTFNICINEPVDYKAMADYLRQMRQLPPVVDQDPYRSTWLDNTKAKFLLDWKPCFDLPRIIEDAWSYQRGSAEPRRVWYAG